MFEGEFSGPFFVAVYGRHDFEFQGTRGVFVDKVVERLAASLFIADESEESLACSVEE